MDYVYAVVEPPLTAPAGAGVDGSPLRVVANGELAAVVSDRSDAQLLVSEEALWAHERVVEGLMGGGPVLPMRFGSLLPDDQAVESMLCERGGEFTAALKRVGGAVELGVRAAWDPEAAAAEGPGDQEATAAGGATDPATPGPGAVYLLGRSRSRQRAGALAERLDRAVVTLCRARVQRLLTSPSLPVSAAYLVDHRRVNAFRDRIALLEAEVKDAEIVCTGPWPPYSFTGAQGT